MAENDFTVIGDAIVIEAGSGFGDEVDDLVEDIRVRVQRLNREFFRTLANKAIDVGGPPALGVYTPEWAPLKDTYTQWKADRGRSTNFYKKSGALEAEVKMMRASSILGQPRVRFFPARRVGNPGVRTETQQFTKKDGTVVFRKVARSKKTGRFTSMSEAMRDIRAKIRVEPFPRLTDLDAAGMFGEGTKTFYKFMNPVGREMRPIIREYLQWWLNVKVAGAVEKGLRNR